MVFSGLRKKKKVKIACTKSDLRWFINFAKFFCFGLDELKMPPGWNDEGEHMLMSLSVLFVFDCKMLIYF